SVYVAVFVEILGIDWHLAAVGVDGDDRLLGGVGHALAGGDKRVGEGIEQRVHRHALLALEDLKGLHELEVGRHQRAPAFDFLALFLALSLALPRSAGSQTNTVRAFSTST